nr:RNA 2',3'-cyclic phosphodiesterase [Dehalococcoidia bacterium]
MTTSGEKKVRSFIAILVPSEGIEALEQVVKSLDQEIGRHVRWVRPEGIHVTLKFMGDIPAATVEQLLEALPPVAAGFSPFELAISGLGAFPNLRRPRVLWAGLDGELTTLSELQLAVDEAVGKLGLPREQRAFSPHLTLGRVRSDVAEGQLRKIGEVMSSTEIPSIPGWPADTVSLMRTELDPAGSRHYLVGSAPIGGK